MSDVNTVEAIYDLAKVFVAVSGKFETKAEAVRRLSEFAIPTGRIATILAMKPSDVASILAKDRKRQGAVNGEVELDRV
jgi:hypothetical protein